MLAEQFKMQRISNPIFVEKIHNHCPYRIVSMIAGFVLDPNPELSPDQTFIDLLFSLQSVFVRFQHMVFAL